MDFSIVQSNTRRWQTTIIQNFQCTLLTVDLCKYKTYSQNVSNDDFSVYFLIIFDIALLFGETQFEFSSLLIKSRSACRCFSSTKKQLKCEEKALEANMKACILLKNPLAQARDENRAASGATQSSRDPIAQLSNIKSNRKLTKTYLNIKETKKKSSRFLKKKKPFLTRSSEQVRPKQLKC